MVGFPKLDFRLFYFKQEMSDELRIEASDLNLISVRLFAWKEAMMSSWTSNTGYQKRSILLTNINTKYLVVSFFIRTFAV